MVEHHLHARQDRRASAHRHLGEVGHLYDKDPALLDMEDRGDLVVVGVVALHGRHGRVVDPGGPFASGGDVGGGSQGRGKGDAHDPLGLFGVGVARLSGMVAGPGGGDRDLHALGMCPAETECVTGQWVWTDWPMTMVPTEKVAVVEVVVVAVA